MKDDIERGHLNLTSSIYKAGHDSDQSSQSLTSSYASSSTLIDTAAMNSRTLYTSRMHRIMKHLIWITLQIIIFAFWTFYYATTPTYKTFRNMAGPGFIIARSAAMSLCINCALLMLPVCFKLISCVERWRLFKTVGQMIPIMLQFHVHVAFTVIVMTMIHVSGHAWDFYRVSKFEHVSILSLVFNGTGFTGLVALASLTMICITATLKRIRRANFEVFYYTHHLYILFFASLMTHGSFCLIKADGPNQCRGPEFWKYVAVPLALYIVDRVLREFGSTAIIQAAILHPSNVLELKLDVPTWKDKSGQYKPGIGSFVRIKCPAVSRLQWHPFTLSSASSTKGPLSVHINVCGDWTRDLSAVFESRVKMSKEMPNLVVSGPYPGMMKSIDEWPVAVVVGGGIGVTPTSSLLKSLVTTASVNNTLRKIYMVWICSDISNFQCLQKDIAKLEQCSSLDCQYEILLYWTAKRATLNTIHYAALNAHDAKDPLTKFNSRTCFGRPDFQQLLAKVYRSNNEMKVGVFTCGSRGLCDSVNAACQALDATQVSIKSHEECF